MDELKEFPAPTLSNLARGWKVNFTELKEMIQDIELGSGELLTMEQAQEVVLYLEDKKYIKIKTL